MTDKKNHEVIIIGGSYAGLSAGMTLGRSLRKVLIIDSGQPCNRQTLHAHSFITQDGETPAAILVKAKAQVLQYPTVQFINKKAVRARKQNDGFVIETESGEKFEARKLLITTGIKDLMPDIPGFAQCWGISVLHCPYCHGYEVKGEKTGIAGNGDTGYDLVKLLYNWSKNLTLFTNGDATLTTKQWQKLQQYNIPIVESTIQEITHDKGYIKQLNLTDGSHYTVNALFTRVAFEQHSNIAQQLGCEYTQAGYILADEFGTTSVAGVFAAGDNTTPMRAVSVASAAGHKAAAWVNKELIEESF